MTQKKQTILICITPASRPLLTSRYRYLLDQEKNATPSMYSSLSAHEFQVLRGPHVLVHG